MATSKIVNPFASKVTRRSLQLLWFSVQEKNLWSTFFHTVSAITGIIQPYQIQNSAHFVSTIGSETILDNEIMVSFDVESLFTNAPIDTAEQTALQKLEDHPSLADRTTLTLAQIADLLNFILRSTYFQP